MKLKFLTRLVWMAAIAALVVSCMDDDIDDYTPPTEEEELALLYEYIDTLESRGLDIDTTDLGVYYVIDSIGEGAYPVDGDTCSVSYTGFFVTGELFDTSDGNTIDVILGEGHVIPGWEDGLKVFNEGGEGYLIIPSSLAYGSTGYLSVPPYTTLVFNIEMKDIKRGY